MKKVFVAIVVAGTLVMAVPTSTDAGSITCPTISPFDRQMTVTNVSGCVYMGPVNGTPGAGDVSTAFGGGTWTNQGALTGNGSDDWLTAAVTTGSWGSIPVAGTWSLDPALWSAFSRAVLTFHLGNGNGNPDWFFFELTSGATSGTFDVKKLSGGGGGFSNVALWTSGPCVDCNTVTQTPEPGTLVLFGGGLALVAMVMRRRTRRS